MRERILRAAWAAIAFIVMTSGSALAAPTTGDAAAKVRPWFDPAPKPIGPGDECKVYSALFAGSGFETLGDQRAYRLQPYEDGSDFAPARAVALRRAIIRRSGGPLSPWNRVSPERFAAAFSFWRAGDLADCDWKTLAQGVVAPADRDKPLAPVIFPPGVAEDQAFTRVFFVDDENGLLLIRTYWPHRAGFTRKIILVMRDNSRDTWGMSWEVLEDLCFDCPVGHNRRYPVLPP